MTEDAVCSYFARRAEKPVCVLVQIWPGEHKGSLKCVVDSSPAFGDCTVLSRAPLAALDLCVWVCVHSCMLCRHEPVEAIGYPWLLSFRHRSLAWSSPSGLAGWPVSRQNQAVSRYLELGFRACPTRPSIFVGPRDKLRSSCLQDKYFTNQIIFLSQLGPL